MKKLIVLLFALTIQFVSIVNITSAEEIVFQDKTFEAMLRSALDCPSGTITEEDLANYDKLWIQGSKVYFDINENIEEHQNITNETDKVRLIEDLSHFPNLTFLNISGQNINNIDVLSKLTHLEYLSLTYNKDSIDDFSALSGLPFLDTLILSNNGISDLSPLTLPSSLKKLDIRSNELVDLAPLSKLTSLVELHLSSNSIVDISPLKNLSSLKELNLGGNAIVDISSIKHLAGLESLNLRENDINDLSPLRKLTSLRYLGLRDNNINDVEPLSDLLLLSLDIQNNPIEDWAPLDHMVNVGGRPDQ